MTANDPWAVTSAQATSGTPSTTPYTVVSLADNTAAGAQPVEDPPVHLDPYEAAKNVRALAREIADYAPQETPSERITEARQHVRHAESYLVRMAEHELQASSLLNELEGSIEERKRAAGRTHLIALRTLLRHNQQLRKSVGHYVTAADSLLLKSQIKKSATVGPRVSGLCDEWSRNARAVATSSNAPLGPAENCLRATAWLMKNTGYLEQTAKFDMHPPQLQPEYHGDDDYEDDYGEEEEE